jgi:YHS domain-containing protein
MSESTAPDRVIDPICDMVVVVEQATSRGLVREHEDRTYAFCSRGCLVAFEKDPVRWAAKAATAVGAAPASRGPITVVDEGLRRWYASCRCCMHDAYPDIVAVLDAERDAAGNPGTDPGICETAEADAAH